MQFHYENIPLEMQSVDRWVCFTADKLPKNPFTGGNAMSNNPKTWGTFSQALDAVRRYNFQGIGFMFAPPYFGVDLDKCLEQTDFVDSFVDTLQSYTEVSKSGTGIHIICKGELPSGARRKGNVEMYSEGRYFAMTGNLYRDTMEIKDCTETIKILHQKHLYTPQTQGSAKQYEKLDMSSHEIIDLARSAKNAAQFEMLYRGDWQGVYTSQSEADLAFCNMLAFWTQRDEAKIDAIFRSSGLMRKKWDTMRSGMSYGARTIERAIVNCQEVYTTRHDVSSLVVSGKGQAKQTTRTDEFDDTDTGNGLRFQKMFGDRIRYSNSRKSWYFWTGKVWELDNTGEIRRLADECILKMKKSAFSIDDEEKQAAALKWAARTAASKAKSNMILETQHLRTISVSDDYFDKQSDIINTQNGIVNLRNGELIPHDKGYNLSKISGVEYSATEREPELWLKFLDDITGGDKELQLFLQRAAGYSLSASTREQCLFFCYGTGRNGKSTFVNVITELAGTYAANIQAETLMQKKQGNGINNDIARLKSARFCSVSEPEEGMKLNESLVKQLTGGDIMTARFLNAEFFEFRPEFKLWISTNHKPIIRGTDEGIWRRIMMLPFTVTIPIDKVDRSLPHKLRAELPLILKWAVDGCIEWQKQGLAPPEAVTRASDEYRSDMDVLSKFIDDCVVSTNASLDTIKANEAYSVYQQWARDNNEYEHTATKFGREFVTRFPHKKKFADGLHYQYCRLSEYAKTNYGVPINMQAPSQYHRYG